jgi:Flp pilus assembly pilin Flp
LAGLRKDEDGAALIEYSVLLGILLIAIVFGVAPGSAASGTALNSYLQGKASVTSRIRSRAGRAEEGS